MEIIIVDKKPFHIAVGGKDEKVYAAVGKYGPCNARLGLTLYNNGEHIIPPPGLEISSVVKTLAGESGGTYKINGVRVPANCSRDQLIFAILISQIAHQHPRQEAFVYWANDHDMFTATEFKRTLDIWKIDYLFDLKYFIFKQEDKLIKVKMGNRNHKNSFLSSFVQEISFE